MAAPLPQALSIGMNPVPCAPPVAPVSIEPLYASPLSSSLQASGSYKMVLLSMNPIPGHLLPDTEQDLVATAFNNSYSAIASYSAIPASTRITLEIQGHGEAPSSPGLGGMGVSTTPTQPLHLPVLQRQSRCL